MDITRENIYSNLLKIDKKTKIDWKASFLNLMENAGYYASCLLRIKMSIELKRMEDIHKKRKSGREIRYEVKKTLEQVMEKSKSEPSKYFPYFPYITPKKKIFGDSEANLLIEIMLNFLFKLPDFTEDNLLDAIGYSLALQGAFYSLACNCQKSEDIPEAALKLIFTLNEIGAKTYNLMVAFEEKEQRADRNSENASTRTPIRIGDYKKNDKYPELERIIKSYQGTPKELRKINNLIETIINDASKIKDTKVSRVTIRRYRHLLFREIQK